MCPFGSPTPRIYMYVDTTHVSPNEGFRSTLAHSYCEDAAKNIGSCHAASNTIGMWYGVQHCSSAQPSLYV